MTVGFVVATTAAPGTNAPAIANTAIVAANRRTRALIRADNGGGLRDFEGRK